MAKNFYMDIALKSSPFFMSQLFVLYVQRAIIAVNPISPASMSIVSGAVR